MELLIWVAVGALVGAMIGERKGRAGEGAALGAILGPLGWLLVFLGPDNKQAKGQKKCPFCAEFVKREAKVCKHCGRDLPVEEPEPVKLQHSPSRKLTIGDLWLPAALAVAFALMVTYAILTKPAHIPKSANPTPTPLLGFESDESMKPTTEASEAERQRRREAQQREAQETYPRAKAVSPEEMAAPPAPTPH